jgi:predicted Zn-ribbon and HTH transcriptional regulator
MQTSIIEEQLVLNRNAELQQQPLAPGGAWLIGCRCDRCGHEWLPRRCRTPRVCPRCRSTRWDHPSVVEPKARAQDVSHNDLLRASY